ncbi:hypothetical protein WJ85_32295 [Burkholderia ubonensis]|nr:hypothetical protein WJ85_32295 [Burkholderia ubonensis]KWC00267.1 hypothetical protein WL44_29955 [Burkholderia ubonensis]
MTIRIRILFDVSTDFRSYFRLISMEAKTGEWYRMYICEFEDHPGHSIQNISINEIPWRDELLNDEIAILTQNNYL